MRREPTSDLGPEDLGPEDLGPEDLGPEDLGPEDLGPETTALETDDRIRNPSLAIGDFSMKKERLESPSSNARPCVDLTAR